jgi:hypothetical protein
MATRVVYARRSTFYLKKKKKCATGFGGVKVEFIIPYQRRSLSI